MKLRALGAFFLASTISTSVLALPATTNANYVVCRSKQWLDDVIQFAISKDNASTQAYLNTQKCVMMKAGLRVTVTESPSMFGGTAQFVFQGVKFWTVREALNYGQ